ncbi:unnamed protein product [Mytilus coruscus]|uniref:Uncharacterized protein n=1 Tax=Mytilus coruscus TaxID=42192 RepID=A0A6J8CB91_MYTCO|nr:unnamed protein product [Mytilus coruscus]
MSLALACASDKLSSDEDKDEQNKSSIGQQDVHSNSIVQEEEYKPECVVYTSFICEQISPKLTYGETEGSLFKDGDTTSHSCTESENHTDLSTENQLDSENNNCSDFKFKYQKNDTVCSWYSVDFPNINYGSNYELENKNYIASYRSNYYGYSSRESHSELDSLNKTAVHSEDYLDLGNNNTELKNQIITAASSEENLDFRNENNKSENKNSTEVLNKDYLEFRKSSKSTELMNKNRTDISSEEYLDSKNNYNKYKSQNETDVSSEEYLDLKNNNNKSKSQNETDVFSEEYLELKNSDNKAKSHKETDNYQSIIVCLELLV